MSELPKTDGEAPESRLNLAGKLARGFLHSKITALIMIALTLFGLMAFFITPRLYNPEIVVPGAQILVQRVGNSAQQIQEQVVKPLEAIMASIKGVDHTYGYAVNDMGIVTVAFKVGSDEERSLLLLYNQLSRNMDKLPQGTSQPLVKSIGITDVPVMTITLSSAQMDGVALRELGERVLDQLQSVPDVGNSSVIGGYREILSVDIHPQKLSSTGIALDTVIHLLKASNVVLPGGSLINNNEQTALRVDAAFSNISDLGEIIIGAHNQRPVFLRDVATIKIAPDQNEQYSAFGYGKGNGQGSAIGQSNPAVTLAIGKRTGANAVTVTQRVLDKLTVVERQMVPHNVDVTVTRDYGKRADDAVNLLMEHLAIAVLVVLIILFFFLGWREALIVTLTVPLTLFVVLGVGYVIGQTINRISLFALILSLGLLVDAAIVVIENIHRHIHEGSEKTFGDLLIRATNEIGNPTNIATIAVIFAFVPMAFVSGMMGPFMLPIPIYVPIAMVASLLLAYIVVPWAAYRWLGGKASKQIAEREAHGHEPHKPDILQRGYTAVIRPLLGSRAVSLFFLIFVLLLMIASMVMPAWQFIRPAGMNGPLSAGGVSLKMLPEGNVSTFVMEVDTPAGTALDETARVVDGVAHVLAASPYVNNYQTFLGRTAPLTFAGMVRGDMMREGSNIAQIRVNIISEHDRPDTELVAAKIWAALKPIREASKPALIKLYLTPPGPPVRAQILARIHGPDYAELRTIANEVKAKFSDVYGMINVDDSVTTTAPEYLIEVDRQKAMQSGVAPAQIAQLINTYVHGTTVGALHEAHSAEPINIVLRLPQTDRASIQQVRDLTITGAGGKQIPVGSLVNIVKSDVAKPILDQDQHDVVYIQGDLLGSSPVYATLTLNQWLNDMKLANNVTLTTGNLGFVDQQPQDIDHYQLLWGGDMRLTLDVFRDLGAAFIVALIFIYLLLVGYYQSFMLPLIVMGAIPLTLVGIFPGHWLLNMPFNATSMIGFIALAGVVVRNSLLLIDFILDYRKQGFELKESVITAGAVRFRPILLTALAIIFGSAVMVTDPVFGGLAVSLIFGTLASTLLTLVVIPILYYFWQLDIQIRQRKRAAKISHSSG
ncbi:MAG: efflux RND transporter permease subunit [Halothiobacillus sp.]